MHGKRADPSDACRYFRKVGGYFFRSVLVERIEQVLAPPTPDSTGRYHRHGEPTLYMSPRQEWAIMAVAGYMREDHRPRVVVPLLVSDALVIDQHDKAACQQLGIDPNLSNYPWRFALAAGQDPESWRNVDKARSAGADGMIDPSRMIPGGWHLNLFRWNGLGGPTIQICGDPVEIKLSSDGPKWGL